MKRLCISTALLAGLLAARAEDKTPDPDFHIYLCFGQSNMEGFPGIEEEDRSPPKGVDVLAALDFATPERKKGQWYPAVPPLCRERTGLCPADYFARTLREKLPERVRIGIVNVSVAGCKIELFDKDSYRVHADAAPSWMKGILRAYDGNPYAHLVATAKIAQDTGVIKGILLHQGESNTNDEEWPKKVKAIYDALLLDLHLEPDSVPLLAGEVVHADQKGACASMNEIIATLPKVIPNAHVISSAGCEARRDRLHFTPQGYRELGKRYGEKMLALLEHEAVRRD
jgi:hypothetical protein